MLAAATALQEVFSSLTKLSDPLVNTVTYFAKKRRVERSRKKLLWEVVTKVLDDYCPVRLHENRVPEVNFFFQTQKKHKGAWEKLNTPRSQISLLILAIICNGQKEDRVKAMLSTSQPLEGAENEATHGRHKLNWHGSPETDFAKCYAELYTDAILPKIAVSIMQIPREVLAKVREEANKWLKEEDLMDPPPDGEGLKGWLSVSVLEHFPTIIGGHAADKKRIIRLIPRDKMTQKILWKLTYGMKMGKEPLGDPQSSNYQSVDEEYTCKKEHIWHVKLYRKSDEQKVHQSVVG